MNEEIKRLSEEAGKCVTQARQKMDDWEKEHKGQPVPADLDKEIDGLLAKADEFKAQMDAEFKKVERTRRLDVLKADMEKVVNRVPMAALKSENPLAPHDDQPVRRALEIKAFSTFLRGGMKAVRSQLAPEEQKALSVSVDTEGGYLAPEEFRAEVIRKLADVVNIRARATVLTTARESIVVPTLVTEQDAAWTAENAEIPASDEAFGEKRLRPFKLTRGTRVSNELLADSAINLLDLLSSVFADKFAKAEDSAFIEGTGQGQPEGVKISSIVTDYQPSGTTITADKLIDTIYQIKSQYRQRAAWLIRRSNVQLIRKLKDQQNQYLWSVGLQPGQPNMLLGYPVLETEKLDAEAASAIVAIYGDWSYYWIADRADFAVKRLEERYAEYDQVGIIAIKRTDGAPVLGDAFTRLKMAAS